MPVDLIIGLSTGAACCAALMTMWHFAARAAAQARRASEEAKTPAERKSPL